MEFDVSARLKFSKPEALWDFLGHVPANAEVTETTGLIEQKLPRTYISMKDFMQRVIYLCSEPEEMERIWQVGSDVTAAFDRRIREGDEPGQHDRHVYHDGNPTLNLNLLLRGMQQIEIGMIQPGQFKIDRTAWNIFAGFIKERLGENVEDPIIQSWDDEIHPYLNEAEDVRVQAIAALQTKYQSLGQPSTSTHKQLPLF